MTENTVFIARGLSKTFGGVRAVTEMSLSLNSNKVSGLIGPNGAGKSTLVDLLSGQQRSEAGSIVLRGHDISGMAPHEFVRRGIARTFQTSRLTRGLTVFQVVEAAALSSRHVSAWGYVAGLRHVRRQYAAIQKIVDSTLEQVELSDVRQEYVRNIRWEQQRRLEIARALAMDCAVLLLDEPTAGMSAESLPRFSSLIRAIAKNGVAVLLIEHNVSFIQVTVDDLYAMEAGSLLTSGSVPVVLADERVISSYLGSVRQ